jgi:hypothetical protein
MPYDSIAVHTAVEYVKDNRPRVLWLTFGETDEWAHERRYDRYLQAARMTDDSIRTLWETVQAMPQYRGRTTLMVGVDHGRGRSVQDWTSHGVRYPGADEIWTGVLGPDTPALGERSNIPEVTQSQLAATAASALGYDYRASVPKAGSSLPVFHPAP